MAASARLRSTARRSAAERNEVLALTDESRRLQSARAERARRAQLAREKIARCDVCQGVAQRPNDTTLRLERSLATGIRSRLGQFFVVGCDLLGSLVHLV